MSHDETHDEPTTDDAMPPEPATAPPPGVRAMSILRWLLVALAAFIATGSLLSYLRTSAPTTHEAAHVYHCPMHPQIVQDHPGECPICGMNLVLRPETPPAPPQRDGGLPGLAAIELPLDRIQTIGVRTRTVKRQPLPGGVRTVGVVEANERGLAKIAPRFSGFIEQLFVAETGQVVKAGQVLATIFSPEILQAQQELLTAQGWKSTPGAASPTPHREALDDLLGDARHRLELLGISPAEIDAIAKSGRVQRAIPLRSPVSGHVIAKTAVAGMNVAAGAELFAIADLSTVWVIADVYEADLARVRIGQPARFSPSASPELSIAGKVKFLAPTLDPASRTLRVRLELPNRIGVTGGGFTLRPGMYGSVALDLPGRSGLLAPAEALVDTGELRYVFVARPGGRFEPRAVTVGARAGDEVELLTGVREGEDVVTTANFLIDSESRLRAALAGRSQPTSSAP
jgi:Cu(I)/Ag(I) efflux system membrane fusion protein